MIEHTPEGLPVVVDELLVSIIDTERKGHNFDLSKLVSDEVCDEMLNILRTEQPTLCYILEVYREDDCIRGMLGMYKLLREQAIANQLEQNLPRD